MDFEQEQQVVSEIKKYVTYNPMYEVIKPKSNKETKVVEALEINVQKEFTQYLNKVSIEEQPYKNIFLIQMYMGLRIGEVLALNVNNFDLEKQMLNVNKTLTLNIDDELVIGDTAKTYASKRTIPIPDFLIGTI